MKNTDIRFILSFLFYGKLHKNQPYGPSAGFGGNFDRCRRHYLKLSPYHPLELVFGEAVNQLKPIALAQRKVHAVCHQDAFAVQLERFVHVDEYAAVAGQKAFIAAQGGVQLAEGHRAF